MKKYLRLELSKTETVIFIAILGWVIASCFIPLPDVNSLGR